MCNFDVFFLACGYMNRVEAQRIAGASASVGAGSIIRWYL